MANSIADNLEAAWKKLPNAMNGNGQNFIFLLKELLGNLTEQLNAKFEEISKLSNSITNTPDTIDEQLKDCKIKEVRVGTAISLVLSWDYSNIKNYESAEIYVKEHEGNIASIIDWSAVDVSRTIRTTKTNTYTVDGINAGYVYQITFVGKNNLGSVSKKDSAPVLVYAVSALNNVPDPPLEFDVYFSREGVLWKWKQPNNLDYSYSELRTNQDVGNKVGLLEVTQDTKSTVLPPTREGTAYLYNKGYGSKYSTPLDKEWSKPVPTAPQMLEVTSTYQGLQFTYSKIPEDCIGICISINGNKHYSQDDKYNFYCSTGTYTIKACYYDVFGEGTWTGEQTVGTEEEIPPDAVHITKKTVFDDGVIVGKYIGDKEIVGTKIQDDTITTGNLAANAVTAGKIATNAVTTDKIDAGSITTDKIKAGAVTADTIGAGAITSDKLTVGAVTADKLAANEIKLAGALKVVGGNVTLDENGLTCKTSSRGSVIFNSSGMIFKDSLNNTFAALGRFCTGVANDGDTVKFASAWDVVPTVFLFAQKFQTSAVGYSNVNIYQVVYPENVTESGFKVVCKSVLGAGSNNSIVLNKEVAALVYSKESGNGITPTYNKDWTTYNIDIPSSATHANISLSGYVDWSISRYNSHGTKWRGTNANIYIKIFVDGTEKVGEYLFLTGKKNQGGSSDKGRETNSQNIPLNLSDNTKISVFVRFTLDLWGNYSNYTMTNVKQASVTINSITSDTNIDTVISRGTAGFIAIDPNSCPYTVTKG